MARPQRHAGWVAAALRGLLFVAASPHLDILASPRHVPLRALALHTLIGYLTLLLIATCLLILGQSELRLGLELASLDAAGLGWLPNPAQRQRVRSNCAITILAMVAIGKTAA